MQGRSTVGEVGNLKRTHPFGLTTTVMHIVVAVQAFNVNSVLRRMKLNNQIEVMYSVFI